LPRVLQKLSLSVRRSTGTQNFNRMRASQ